jgi:ribosomal protein S18 acetylase RimI-like enzyme
MGTAEQSGVDEIVVRRAGLEDAAMLALVGAATFLDGFAGVLPGEAMVAHAAKHHVAEVYAGYLKRPEVAAWLAVTRNGGAPVGYAMVTSPELPEETMREGDLELKRIYALSRFHGTGVAQQLMETAVGEAEARGAKRVTLGVYAGNARALRFYARNGFRQIGTRRFKVGLLVCDDFVMGRRCREVVE